MLTIALITNLVTALLCLYVAWQLWNLRKTLANVADALDAVERSTHAVLDGAPDAITRGQMGVYQLRQASQRSGPQFQRLQRALALLGLGQSIWRRSPGVSLRQFPPLGRRARGTAVKRL